MLQTAPVQSSVEAGVEEIQVGRTVALDGAVPRVRQVCWPYALSPHRCLHVLPLEVGCGQGRGAWGAQAGPPLCPALALRVSTQEAGRFV